MFEIMVLGFLGGDSHLESADEVIEQNRGSPKDL